MLLYTISTDKWNDRCFLLGIKHEKKPDTHFLYLLGPKTIPSKYTGEPKKKTSRGNREWKKGETVLWSTNGAESTIISNYCTENINSFWNPLKCLCFAWVRVIKASNTFSSCSHLNFGIPFTMITNTVESTRSPSMYNGNYFVASENSLKVNC